MPNAAYDLLHPAMQRWVYDQGWPSLRPIQERAIPVILPGEADVILTAATAGGKTEAAWFPILSRLAFDADAGTSQSGVKALYLSPLKALINDQAMRLEMMASRIEQPVRRRHGDVSGAERDALKSDPAGLLLMTPESLEALFMLDGPAVNDIFRGLRFVVIDELHAFIGSERGAQLQSLLHRLDVAVGHDVPRIALSATLADTSIAARFLRPERPDAVAQIDNGASGSELAMSLRGYEIPDGADDLVVEGIARHIFRHLRGENNLVFANSRAAVEAYTDRLVRMSDEERVPNEFVAHHGSLSKQIREDVERRLKSDEVRTTAICTSTLEMGIDIGSVASIGQIGSPGVASALRQRLGRSGRRGAPAVLRVYVGQKELTEDSHPEEKLRTQLIESIAILDLLLEHWIEPPHTGSLHLSTLVQQILSVIAQNSGARAETLFRTLCQPDGEGSGPFAHVDHAIFADVLRALGASDVLMQTSSGILLPTPKGEKILNHYTFYTAFTTDEEYRLIAGGQTLGTLPIEGPVVPGTSLIFAGRRWAVEQVDSGAKVIDVVPTGEGTVPTFSGGGAIRDHTIRQRLREVLTGDAVPAYLNETATQMLSEAREAFREMGLDRSSMIEHGDHALLFPWSGDRVMTTLELMLSGWESNVSRGAVSLTVYDTSAGSLERKLRGLLEKGPPDAFTLAAKLGDQEIDRHDALLTPELRRASAAARDLDIETTMDVLLGLAG